MSTSPAAIQQSVSLFSHPARLRRPAFRVIDRMDGTVSPADQLLGTAVALVAMADAVGIPMRDLILIAERAMGDVDSHGAEHIKAIRDYAKHELPRHRR